MSDSFKEVGVIVFLTLIFAFMFSLVPDNSQPKLMCPQHESKQGPTPTPGEVSARTLENRLSQQFDRFLPSVSK